MRFKSPEVEAEFRRAHPKIISLALYADWYSQAHFGVDLMLTDVERSQEEYDRTYPDKLGPNGHYQGPMPHKGPPSRATDNRVDSGGNHPGEITVAQNEELRDHMNDRFKRRDGKPTMMVHDVGRGLHSHLQAEA